MPCQTAYASNPSTLLLVGLVVALLGAAFAAWGWAAQRNENNRLRKLNAGCMRGLEAAERGYQIAEQSYRQLVEVFNERTVGATLKHKTGRLPQ